MEQPKRARRRKPDTAKGNLKPLRAAAHAILKSETIKIEATTCLGMTRCRSGSCAFKLLKPRAGVGRSRPLQFFE
jgi:hypothetical protein